MLQIHLMTHWNEMTHHLSFKYGCSIYPLIHSISLLLLDVFYDQYNCFFPSHQYYDNIGLRSGYRSERRIAILQELLILLIFINPNLT